MPSTNKLVLRKYKEGKVIIIAPDLEYYGKGFNGHIEPAWSPVFYNPRMRVTRDIGTAVIAAFGKSRGDKLSIIDLLSATGIRGIRYAVETSSVEEVHLNDLNPIAYKLMLENVKINGISPIARVYKCDARFLPLALARAGILFDVIEIDPFGSPIPFLPAAIQSIKNKGLICITATDLPPLYGVYPGTCMRKYWSVPIRSEYSNEVGVRILLHYVLREAGKYGYAIKPLLSIASMHFIRLHIQLFRSREEAERLMREFTGYVVHCEKCLYRRLFNGLNPNLPVICPSCGSRLRWAGPLWLGPLGCRGFIDHVIYEYKLRQTYLGKRGLRILELIREEVEQPPLYYTTDSITSKYSMPHEPSPKAVVERLRELGFRASQTHFSPKGFKTDAPPGTVFKVIASLVESHSR